MRKRWITAIIMFVILVPIVIVPQLKDVGEILVIIFAICGLFELLNMYGKVKKIPIPMMILTVVLMLALYVATLYFIITTVESLYPDGSIHAKDSIVLRLFIRGEKLPAIVSPVFAIIVIFIVLMASLVFIHHFDTSDLGRLYIAIIYIGISVACFHSLYLMGTRFLIYLLVTVMGTDAFALFIGMPLGKHKMAPKISPKKTWEGAIGGSAVAVTVATSVIMFYQWVAFGLNSTGTPLPATTTGFFQGIFRFDDFPLWGQIGYAFLFTLFISVAGQVGDLIASKLKRTYGIKDYSQIFPGHGGILDRFDSSFFAAAVFVAFLLFSAAAYGA